MNHALQRVLNSTRPKNSIIRDFFFLVSVVSEFIRGFFLFERIGPAVTIFGSARFQEDHPFCKETRALSGKISKAGYTLITGGGPGIMEAANRGAREAGGNSVGANIVIPHEQRANRFLDRVVTFEHFFVRKFMLMRYSRAFVIFPGGFGTLDEVMEALTLLQTGKLKDIPVIFVGKAYWADFLKWLQGPVLDSGAISASSLDLYTVTDDHEEILRILANTP